jgi:hypothetical protein
MAYFFDSLMIMAEIVVTVISMPMFDCRDSKDEIIRKLKTRNWP